MLQLLPLPSADSADFAVEAMNAFWLLCFEISQHGCYLEPAITSPEVHTSLRMVVAEQPAGTLSSDPAVGE